MPIACRPAAHVISDALEGDRIVIDIQTGAYYTLTPTAAAIWAEAADGGQVDDAPERVGVLMRLLDEGLLLSDTEPTGGVVAPADEAFTRYTDMEELLLVDPIHEVDNEGWPVFKRPDD
jgi:hypothetical protein